LIAILFGFAILISAVLLALRWFYAPPRTEARDVPQKLRLMQEIPQLSGIRILDEGQEAFAARLALVRSAGKTIDAQYYMWHADMTGRLLMHELLQAADRGIKVRLLLDDHTTAGTDEFLAAAALHDNVQVRLFNPFILRRFRWLSYVFDLHRVNRRMHNKSLTVDGVTSIVGGRNVGDEYFAAREDLRFADMDVLVQGKVVEDVTKSFEAYWQSRSAFPAERILEAVDPESVEKLQHELHHLSLSQVAVDYLEDALNKQVARNIVRNKLDLDEVPVRLAVDDPAKGLGTIPRRKLLVHSFEKQLGIVENTLDIATAYFVPGRFGTRFLARAASSGNRVRVLTNSLASNDVVPVHAGYARYRKRLLRRGIALHELRPAQHEVIKLQRKRLRFGALSSSLHAKVFVVDSKRVFIGSFNLDPRSLYLNCEMGLMIDSERLGDEITRQIDNLTLTRSYQPFLERGNRLSWRNPEGKVSRTEPGSTARQRVVAWVFSWLPVEWLL
jgi:cardiolipin synthase C